MQRFFQRHFVFIQGRSQLPNTETGKCQQELVVSEMFSAQNLQRVPPQELGRLPVQREAAHQESQGPQQINQPFQVSNSFISFN